MHRKGGSHAASIKPTVADHIRRHLVDLDLLDRSKPSVPSSGRSASGQNRRKNPYCSKHQAGSRRRSEEHTSELQSRLHLVCRLLLEKKKKKPQSSSCA